MFLSEWAKSDEKLLADFDTFKKNWEVLVARSNLSIILITCLETALNDNCTPVQVDLAISALYKMVLKASESQPTTPVKINYYKTVNPLSDMLLKHWTASFVGPSFSILRDKIRDYEKDNAFDYYSKLLLFVQSSGTGKSRLADHFGKSYPTINYVIRKGEYGYPPNDPEMSELPWAGSTNPRA
jgi:hypothetical protein